MVAWIENKSIEKSTHFKLAVKFKSKTNTIESSGFFTIEENLDKWWKKVVYVEFFNTFYAEWLQIGS